MTTPGNEPVPIDQAADVTADNIVNSVISRLLDGDPADAQAAIDALDRVVEQRRRTTGVPVWRVHPS